MANLNYIRVNETYGEGANHRYSFTSECVDCKGHFQISVGGPELHAYHNGEGLLQDLFPYLSADNRELLFQSGRCGPCWAALWGEEE